jgi:hypothetical protein
MSRGPDIHTIIVAVNEFIDWHFTSTQIKRLMKRTEEKTPFGEAAEKIHAAIIESSPLLTQMLEDFTPHSACKFSLLREVLHVRYDAEKTVIQLANANRVKANGLSV